MVAHFVEGLVLEGTLRPGQDRHAGKVRRAPALIKVESGARPSRWDCRTRHRLCGADAVARRRHRGAAATTTWCCRRPGDDRRLTSGALL